MQEKLSALAAHLTEVEQQLADPAVYADHGEAHKGAEAGGALPEPGVQGRRGIARCV